MHRSENQDSKPTIPGWCSEEWIAISSATQSSPALVSAARRLILRVCAGLSSRLGSILAAQACGRPAPTPRSQRPARTHRDALCAEFLSGPRSPAHPPVRTCPRPTSRSFTHCAYEPTPSTLSTRYDLAPPSASSSCNQPIPIPIPISSGQPSPTPCGIPAAPAPPVLLIDVDTSTC